MGLPLWLFLWISACIKKKKNGLPSLAGRFAFNLLSSILLAAAV